MKKLRWEVVLVILLVITSFSCARFSNLKDPFSKLYKDADKIVANGGIAIVEEVYSVRRDLARKKVLADGRRNLAFFIETKVQALEKRFIEEITDIQGSDINETFSAVSKSVANQTINGAMILGEPMFQTDNNTNQIICCAIVGISPKSFKASLMDDLQKNDHKVYTRFRESEAMKELNEEIEKYEKSNLP